MEGIQSAEGCGGGGRRSDGIIGMGGKDRGESVAGARARYRVVHGVIPVQRLGREVADRKRRRLRAPATLLCPGSARAGAFTPMHGASEPWRL